MSLAGEERVGSLDALGICLDKQVKKLLAVFLPANRRMDFDRDILKTQHAGDKKPSVTAGDNFVRREQDRLQDAASANRVDQIPRVVDRACMINRIVLRSGSNLPRRPNLTVVKFAVSWPLMMLVFTPCAPFLL